MSVKKTTTTTVTQVGNQRPQTRTSASTSVTHESPRQRARRVASENSTFFRFVLSGSLGLLFMVMILLVGTTAFYVENQDDLTWLNSDGTFNENSYNLQITVTNDTPLIDLNGLTLNEVFEGQAFVFDEHFNGSLNETLISGGNYAFLNNQYLIFDTSLAVFLYYEFINNGNIYLNISGYSDGKGSLNLRFENVNIYPQIFQFSIDNFISIKTNQNTDQLRLNRYPNTGISYIDRLFILDLDELGLENLTKEQLDEYYDIYINNKEKRLMDSFYGLGDVVVSNYQGFGQNIAQPASQILDALRPRIENFDEGIDMIRDGWKYIFTGELFVDLWKEIWGDE
jgi:hypothetical protein